MEVGVRTDGGEEARSGSSGKRNPSCVYDPSEGLMWDMDSLPRKLWSVRSANCPVLTIPVIDRVR